MKTTKWIDREALEEIISPKYHGMAEHYIALFMKTNRLVKNLNLVRLGSQMNCFRLAYAAPKTFQDDTLYSRGGPP